jgi:Rrf2 family nitric oxide-sensitive transcriptional repressor
VETTRGKGGGMRLARAPEQVNLGDVVRGAEEDLAIVECFQKNNTACPIGPSCALAEILAQAMRAFFDKLDSHTLADLLVQQEKLAGVLRIHST